MARHYHINNGGTNLTSNTSAGATTSPVNAVPSITVPFYAAFDATNINGHYEEVEITGKTATNLNHAATTYAHTTAEEVRFPFVATEADQFSEAINSGWVAYSTVTPTYTSADDPTYTITFASVDLTSMLGVGMRVKFTNNSTTFYGIITAIAFSTNTVVTLYGGTDYDVANSAISSFYYSAMKAPLGFPQDPTKWTQILTDTSSRAETTPVTNTWYNPGSLSLSIPIGVWRVNYQATIFAFQAGVTTINMESALSTANNSASDADLKAYVANGGASGTMAVYGTVFREKTLVLAAKTPYYLNIRSVVTADEIYIKGDLASTVIRAICAYL